MIMGLASSLLQCMIIFASDGHAEGASSLTVGSETLGGELRIRIPAASLFPIKLNLLAVASSFSAGVSPSGASEITRFHQQPASSAVLSSA